MKTCISSIIQFIGRIMYLWRTRIKYDCRKCTHYGTSTCPPCKVMCTTKKMHDLPMVGVPSGWERSIPNKHNRRK